jgi:hypothetical protein
MERGTGESDMERPGNNGTERDRLARMEETLRLGED